MCFLAGVCFLPLVSFSQTQKTSSFSKTEKVRQRLQRKPVLKSRGRSTKNFHLAEPEDITNQNFPDLIDSFDYPKVGIQELVRTISKMTGKNFILSPDVKGDISIITPSQITVAEAYQAFLAALASRGFTVVKSGKFLKVIRSSDATKHAIETYSGEYFPNTEQVITKIIKLKFIDATQTANVLKGSATSKSQRIQVYEPTNSLIVTDYGTSIERLTQIIKALDVKGFAEKMVVIKIKYAKAKELANLLMQIIEKQSGGSTSSTSRYRRSSFRLRGNRNNQSSKKTKLSVVIPDERTNSLIVVGNSSGIQEIRELVGKLDFSINPEDSGGLYVYYVRYGDAESIAKTLNQLAKEKKQKETKKEPPRRSFDEDFYRRRDEQSQSSNFLSENVSIIAEPKTNSLIISASRQDYKTVKSLLEKLDIPRDQVFVKMVIMELASSKTVNWELSYYKFIPGTNGFGRIGVSTSSLEDFLAITRDRGGTIGFGFGEDVELKLGTPGNSVTEKVNSVSGFVKFLKKNAGGNILSNPNIMALDNEEAYISVGANLPVETTSSTNVGNQSSIRQQKVELSLKLTPRISPKKDKVKIVLDQKIDQVSEDQSLVQSAVQNRGGVLTTSRNLKTTILVNNKETAVLGGLMRDKLEKNEGKVPILGDLPLVGWLFKSYKKRREKTHLVMFITPQVIQTHQEHKHIFTETIGERLDFIEKNFGGSDPHKEALSKLSTPSDPKEKKVEDELDPVEPREEAPEISLPEEPSEFPDEEVDLEKELLELEEQEDNSLKESTENKDTFVDNGEPLDNKAEEESRKEIEIDDELIEELEKKL